MKPIAREQDKNPTPHNILGEMLTRIAQRYQAAVTAVTAVTAVAAITAVPLYASCSRHSTDNNIL